MECGCPISLNNRILPVIRLELDIVVLVVVDDKLLTLKWKIDTMPAATRPVRNVSF